MDYETPATKESVEKTISSLKANNFEGLSLKTGTEAFEKIKELI